MMSTDFTFGVIVGVVLAFTLLGLMAYAYDLGKKEVQKERQP